MKYSRQSRLIGFDQTQLSEFAKDLDIDLFRLSEMVKGRIRFGTATDGYRGENIAGIFQVYTSNATPDTEDTIAHGLGAVPQGYFVVRRNKAGVVYDGTTAWDTTNIYLKCNVASVTVTLFLLK